MDVPYEIQKCVCFLGFSNSDTVEDEDSIVIVGTGFFISKPSLSGEHTQHCYLVTAKHILDSVAHRGLHNLYLRLNGLEGNAKWLGTKLSEWIPHPNATGDIALISFGVERFGELDQKVFSLHHPATSTVLQDRQIGIGDDIFFPGLFWKHVGKSKNVPILRTGTIAALLDEPITRADGKLMYAYLIEARSIGGLSGSPVFVNLGGIRRDTVADAEFALFGVVHGHYDEHLESNVTESTSRAEWINMGIAIVVPVEQVLETLNEPALVAREQEAERRQLYGPAPPLIEVVYEVP